MRVKITKFSEKLEKSSYEFNMAVYKIVLIIIKVFY